MRGLSRTQVWLRLWTICACIAYARVLEWSFETVETQIGYPHYEINPPPDPYLSLCYALIVLPPVLWMPLSLVRPSQFACWIIYATWLVPVLLLSFHASNQPYEETAQLVLLCAFAFAVLCAVCRVRAPVLPRIKFKSARFRMLLAVATVVAVLVVSNLASALPILDLAHLFDLTQVYFRRLLVRELIPEAGIVGYTVATLNSALGPLCIAYGLTTRRWLLTLLGVLGMVMVFVLNGTKFSLFAPAGIASLLYFQRFTRRWFGIALLSALAAGVLLSGYRWQYYSDATVSELFTRRSISDRGITTVLYYETFRHDPVYMRDSILMDVIGLRRLEGKAILVGDINSPGGQEHYNGNTWAMLFGDFGTPGMVLASVFVGLLLLLMDALATRAPRDVVVVMAVFFASIWGEIAVYTSMLSNGVFPSLILLYLMGGDVHARGARHQSVPRRDDQAAARRCL